MEAPSGPGERFALGPTPPAAHIPPPELPTELPEAYGTGRLLLTARDPHWLYASWDLTAKQRQRYNQLSRDGHLVVRTFIHERSGTPVDETHVQPESNNWFISVPHGGTRYTAELGFYDQAGGWQTVASSDSTFTPPEAMAEERAVEFATIPPDVSLTDLFQVVEQAVSENVPLREAVEQLQAETWTDLGQVAAPPPSPGTAIRPSPSPSTPPAKQRRPRSRLPAAPAPPWSPVQAHAFQALVRLDESRRVWMGSLEITELIRRHLRQEISSAALPEKPTGAAEEQPGVELSAISSPLAPGEQPRPGEQSFWLNVNAELVLYGATDRKAGVTVAGRPIRLRPDGTFSFRFALPDGEYPLRITATSADKSDRRIIQLRFARRTQVEGAVGVHPQDARLKPPVPASVA